MNKSTNTDQIPNTVSEISTWGNIASKFCRTITFTKHAHFCYVEIRCILCSSLFISVLHSVGGRNALSNLEFNLVTTSLGNFEECELVREYNPDAPFDTMYCSVIYPYPVTVRFSSISIWSYY